MLFRSDYELTFAVYQAFKDAEQPEKANAALEQALAFEEESEEESEDKPEEK